MTISAAVAAGATGLSRPTDGVGLRALGELVRARIWWVAVLLTTEGKELVLLAGAGREMSLVGSLWRHLTLLTEVGRKLAQVAGGGELARLG